jgi:hypothetical protein
MCTRRHTRLFVVVEQVAIVVEVGLPPFWDRGIWWWHLDLVRVNLVRKTLVNDAMRP